MMKELGDILIEGVRYSFDPETEYMKDGHAYCKNCHERKDGEVRNLMDMKFIFKNNCKCDRERLEKQKQREKEQEIERLKRSCFISMSQALEQMLNRNCTRTKFSERFKRIIDSYNAGGTENEDYYEQLVKLLEELCKEDNRANTEGLAEEELEIYDLLIAGKKLTQSEEQKVKLSAKNLYKKLVDNRNHLLVVDWYKDEQPRAKLKYEVELSLNQDLPDSYDKAAFNSKVSLLMNHFVDMAVQGYGWIGAA